MNRYLRAEARGLRDDELHRHALHRHPDRAPLGPFDDRDDRGEAGECVENRFGLCGGADDGEIGTCVAPPAGLAGRLAAECSGDVSDERPCAVQHEAPLRPVLSLALERRHDPALGLRPDPGHAPEPPRRDRVPELGGRRHAQRAPDLDRPLRREPEEPPEPDELRRRLALELPQLRDLARLDQLDEARFDPRPDPAELAYPSRPHERLDRSLRRPDELSRAAICPRRVEARAGEVEQAGERVELLGDSGVVQGRSGAHCALRRRLGGADHQDARALPVRPSEMTGRQARAHFETGLGTPRAAGLLEPPLEALDPAA